MPDGFWYDDYAVLWRQDRLTAFVPRRSMSLDEKLNAAVRFVAYATAALFLYTSKTMYLYLLPAALLSTKLLHDHGAGEAMLSSTAIDSDAGDLPDRNPRTVVDGATCVPPTADNPFMNVLVSDIKYDPQRPAACPMADDGVRDDAMSKFYDGLFVDAGDVFGNATASRQFYTMPVTEVANDQAGFARACYGSIGDCKAGNMSQCQEHDLRAQRPPVQDP